MTLGISNEHIIHYFIKINNKLTRCMGIGHSGISYIHLFVLLDVKNLLDNGHFGTDWLTQKKDATIFSQKLV